LNISEDEKTAKVQKTDKKGAEGLDF